MSTPFTLTLTLSHQGRGEDAPTTLTLSHQGRGEDAPITLTLSHQRRGKMSRPPSPRPTPIKREGTRLPPPTPPTQQNPSTTNNPLSPPWERARVRGTGGRRAVQGAAPTTTPRPAATSPPYPPRSPSPSSSPIKGEGTFRHSPRTLRPSTLNITDVSVSGKNNQIARARRLRQNATDAEKLLWSALRGPGFAQAKFRRQAPIGKFIVDFVSFKSRLVVEVDGGQHAEISQSSYDARRTKWLEITRVQSLAVLERRSADANRWRIDRDISIVGR